MKETADVFLEGVLSSWIGFGIGVTIAICATIIVIVGIKNIDKLRGFSITKNGISLRQPSLNEAIPRIDANTKMQLFSLVKDIEGALRSVIPLEYLKTVKISHSGESALTLGTPAEKFLRCIMKDKISLALIEAINRNHLASELSKDNVDLWIRKVCKEVRFRLTAVGDYCGVDLPEDMSFIEGIVRDVFVGSARARLIESVQNKLGVYNKMLEGEEKVKLIEKSLKYIDGLKDRVL